MNKLYGIKRPQGFKEKIKRGIQRRQDAGLHFGRPREAVTFRFFCELCGRLSEDAHGKESRVACSQNHAQRLVAIGRRKLPDDEMVATLYKSGLTTVGISELFKVDRKAVRKALERAGCPRRRSGWRERDHCKASGCTEPIYKIWHAVHKKYYGTLCERHFHERRKGYGKKNENRKDRSISNNPN